MHGSVDFDATGVVFDDRLLSRLLEAFIDPESGAYILGRAGFEGARFPAGVSFAGTVFARDVSFDRARFEGDVLFGGK